MIPIKLNDISIINKHYDAIRKFLDTPGIKYKYEKINSWIKKVTSDSYDLESLIKAKPEKFTEIISSINKKIGNSYNIDTDKHKKDSNYSISQYFSYIYDKFSNMQDKHFNSIGYTALDLVYALDLSVCPYCNRSFISSTKLMDKTGAKYIKRTAQLDHFYPKSDFPFLAISFYNLIPVCPICNHIKLDKKLEVNPYEIDNSDEHIIFSYDFNKSLKDIKVSTVHLSNAFGTNWNVLGLDESYQAHKNYVSDLLLRMEIYNSLYMNDLKKYMMSWNGKGDSGMSEITEDNIKRAIIGNYFKEEDLSKFPLSKLTKDIVQQYL